ncbi:hypothetical protein [Shinella zoogloeoides]|uniref:hypothetical protein n=1 Tax=Shinella zoogloeoides TaxID=352475 RepID=UPI00299E2720|nr:hypothetical protein [Shinella zoogloeoides]
MVEALRRVARNILAALIHVDPLEAFPGDDQADRRERFRGNPHREFLACSPDEQRAIAEILDRSLGPAIVELCVLVEEDTKRQMRAQ